jgi:hypothetical protein
VLKVDGPLLLSVDGGRTFSSVGNAAHGDFHDVWIDPDNRQRSLHIFGDLKIEIFDAHGKLVDTVAASKTQGRQPRHVVDAPEAAKRPAGGQCDVSSCHRAAGSSRHVHGEDDQWGQGLHHATERGAGPSREVHH